jgi:hypothetical protein
LAYIFSYIFALKNVPPIVMKRNRFLTSLIVWCFPFSVTAQLSFLENKGQWDQQVLFAMQADQHSFFLQQNGYTVVLKDPGENEASNNLRSHPQHKFHEAGEQARVRAHAYRVRFSGAKFKGTIIKEKPLDGYVNFFVGNDRSRWASGCIEYRVVTYKDIYPGIDLRYSTENNVLKYDFIVNPGADASVIQLHYEGANGLKIVNDELLVQTSVGDAKELKPLTYQIVNGENQPVSCSYQLKGSTVSFNVANYNKSQPLVIDPVLTFSSFSGSTTDNWGFTGTPGPDGSFYSAGIAGATGFPVSTGAIQSTGSGGSSAQPADISIIRLSADGTTRLYATYLGGNGLEQPHSMVADASGNLIITGRTNSTNFPVTTALGVPGGYDIFVTKINADGTAIIGSTVIGGSGNDGVNITENRLNGASSILRSYGDDTRSEVVLDANNNILLASCTNSSNFYTVNGFQSFTGGQQDAVLIKFNPSANGVIWSTYLGGAGDDGGFSLASHAATGKIYVCGGTNSSNFPSSSGGFSFSYNGGVADGFVAQLVDNGSGVTLTRSTYLGTSQVDIAYAIKLDPTGYPYVVGTTMGNWPISNATYFVANSRQFITKLQPELDGIVYSTTFGTAGATAPNISPTAFFVDNCENVYVAGWGGAMNSFGNPYPNAGTTGLPVTADAFMNQTDGSDFYFFVLQKNAASQLYGSFFGQIGGNGGIDHSESTSRFDANGILYLTSCANCKSVSTGIPAGSPFPITSGVFGPANLAANGGQCNQGITKFDFNPAGFGCFATSVPSVIGNDAIKLYIYPNPGQGQFQLRYFNTLGAGKKHMIRIYDAKGSMVFEKEINVRMPYYQDQIDIRSKGPGVYTVEIVNASKNRVAAERIVVY